MALTQINHLVHGDSGTGGAASKATTSYSVTANRPRIAWCSFRSNDLADLSTETFQCSSNAGGTVTLKKTVFYDSSTRYGQAVFLVTGGSGTETLTFSFVSGRLTNQQGFQVVELQDADSTAIVQIDKVGDVTTSPVTVTLAAFGNGSNFTLIFAGSNGNTDALTKEAGYTELVNVSAANGPDSYVCEYLGSSDTTPSVTKAGGQPIAAIAMELQGAAAGAAISGASYQQYYRRHIVND